MTILEFRVDGLPPAKSQRSIFGVRSGHHRRLRLLLEAAHRAKSDQAFKGFGRRPLRLEVEVRAPAGRVLGDATNYLGGIADGLEMKKRRVKASGPLNHLGYRQYVGLYEDDRQLKEISYRELNADLPSYLVRLRPIGDRGLRPTP